MSRQELTVRRRIPPARCRRAAHRVAHRDTTGRTPELEADLAFGAAGERPPETGERAP